MKFQVGTKWLSGGKVPHLCTVIDFLVTRNLSGEVVREDYLSQHDLIGPVLHTDCAVTIARGVARLTERLAP